MAYGFAGKVPHSLFPGFRCSSGCSRVFVGLPIELLYAMLHALSISSLWLTRFHGKPLASFASIFMVFLSAGVFPLLLAWLFLIFFHTCFWRV